MADNCAPDANLAVTYSDVSTQDADASLIAHYNYTITRTWKVTDVAGKFTTHNQVITVTDNTAPTFTQPVDIAINCDASHPSCQYRRCNGSRHGRQLCPGCKLSSDLLGCQHPGSRCLAYRPL